MGLELRVASRLFSHVQSKWLKISRWYLKSMGIISSGKVGKALKAQATEGRPQQYVHVSIILIFPDWICTTSETFCMCENNIVKSCEIQNAKNDLESRAARERFRGYGLCDYRAPAQKSMTIEDKDGHHRSSSVASWDSLVMPDDGSKWQLLKSMDRAST